MKAFITSLLVLFALGCTNASDETKKIYVLDEQFQKIEIRYFQYSGWAPEEKGSITVLGNGDIQGLHYPALDKTEVKSLIQYLNLAQDRKNLNYCSFHLELKVKYVALNGDKKRFIITDTDCRWRQFTKLEHMIILQNER